MEYPHEDSSEEVMRQDSLEEALSSMIDSGLSPTDGIVGGPAVGIGGAAPLILPALAMTQPGIRFTTASTVPTEFHQPEGDFLIPKTYAVLMPLAHGAFGVVVKAQIDPSVGYSNPFQLEVQPNAVAIKRIAASVVYKDSYRAKQTYREIVLLKKLRHPNLVRLVDLFSSSAVPAPDPKDVYIVTEAMDCDLGALINSPWECSYELNENHIRYIMHQMFRALKYLHSAEVLHRDLKPQNILVNCDLKVRVCDFGLARTNQPLEGSATGYVTTMWYRAPEVMLTWQHYTSALDMWSIGCIFAEMLNRLQYRVTRMIDTKHVYALFPADNHVEHLEMILGRLGAPPPALVTRSTGAALEWVQTKMKEVAENGVAPLRAQLGIIDEPTAALLDGLLHFDPDSRLSAADALDAMYVAEYRRVALDAHDVCPKLTIQFDTTDQNWDPVFWENMIETEIAPLQAANIAVPAEAPQMDATSAPVALPGNMQGSAPPQIDQFGTAANLLAELGSFSDSGQAGDLEMAQGELSSYLS